MKNHLNKKTEDQTIDYLMNHLKNDNYVIDSFCKGQSRGYDIVAIKGSEKLIVEVKGAKASNSSPTKKRPYFDSGQIKDHFGKAIVKSLETLEDNPKVQIAIAHPDDDDIRKCIGNTIKHINKIGIIHYWVGEDNIQIENL